MAYVAPVMLLFSYTRHPKYKKFLMFIPVVGAALILFILIQGGYQLLHVIELPKIDMMRTIREISQFLQLMLVQ